MILPYMLMILLSTSNMTAVMIWATAFFSLILNSGSQWSWLGTIKDNIYEKITKNQAKLNINRKFWCLVLRKFWALVPKFYLWKRDWAMGSAANSFLDTIFSLISTGLKYATSSNKHHTFGYPQWNKRLLLISASPLINAAPLNTALFRIDTTFQYKLNQNAYGTSIQTIKRWKHCLYLNYY